MNSSTHDAPPTILNSRKRPHVHVADAGDEWREGANDRHEARDHHGHATVALEERFGLVEVVDLQKANVAH